LNIDNIKAWLDEAICFFENADKDTTPDRIKTNRKLCGQAFRNREEIKTWVIANKPAALSYLAKLVEWWIDWNDYFLPGYVPVSGETIDTLPDLILGRLKFIRTKIEEL